jgi:hypothetical protein
MSFFLSADTTPLIQALQQVCVTLAAQQVPPALNNPAVIQCIPGAYVHNGIWNMNKPSQV